MTVTATERGQFKKRGRSGQKFKKHLMSLLAQLSPLHSEHREGATPEKASAEEMSPDLVKQSCPRYSKERDLSAKGAGLGDNADQADPAGGQQCCGTTCDHG